MENTSYNLKFEALCEQLSLGNLKNEPKRIFGGLLHTMYQLQTEKGEYAVKALNPQIMKRKPAMGNYVFSEKAVRIVADSGINALPSIDVKGNTIHEVDGQYYLAFPWFDGKSLEADCVDVEKCKIIGRVLADIHNLDFSSIQEVHEENTVETAIDWNMYIEEAKAQNSIWINDFLEDVEQLYQIEKRANSAAEKNSKNVVVSHRDMDQKNVLWDANGDPMIIDWECAGNVNPAMELMEVALAWASEKGGAYNKEAFRAVIDSYIENGGTINEEVEDILYWVFKGKLGWLEYSIKRSLRIECGSDEEQELGTSEVVGTIQLIRDYLKQIPVLLEWI